ncbi:hypothetical protein GCM10012278_50960 [Nonomuraea glycinis]|uniref:Uncharacterized protein n=1 Tax=Nonomuraea glycinis TaxID=2047744 RepID=A0A918A7P5_9ACTN|nr:hypothetical protein GCM10012278_50960 [Nonomuraea glycinis]
MCALIFEYGIDTLSWYAEFALRRRVSMSAIGSVIVMASGLPRRGFQSAKFQRPALLPGTALPVDLRRGHGCSLGEPPGFDIYGYVRPAAAFRDDTRRPQE